MAASPTPPASEDKKDHHGVSITIDDGSSTSEEARAKLTPDQLYQVELARAQNPSNNSLEDVLVPVLVPLAFFGLILGIVAITVWSRFRRNRMMHDTVRLLAEKGQPLPPEVFQGVSALPKPRSDLRRGIFWTAVGLGLLGYFLVDHSHSWGVGLIPFFIGLGYLLAWKLETPRKPGADA